MADTPGSKLGEAYVQIGAKLDTLQAGLARAEAMVRGTMTRIATLMGFGGGLLGFGKVIQGADQLDRAMRYAGMVFGESSSIIINQSEEMSSKLGTLRTESIRGAAEIGEVFRRAGASSDMAARLSTRLTEAAAATGMIRDVDLPDALKAIEYGLEGSNRGLRRLGVNIHEIQIEMEAMRMGAVKIGGVFQEQDLVAARASLIMRALSGSVRNLDMANLSFGTRVKIVWASFRHVIEDLGKGIAPISNTVVNAFVRMATGISDLVSRNLPAIQNFSEYVVWGFNQVVEAATDLWTRIAANFKGIGVNFNWLKGVAQDTFETIGVLWRNWSLIGERTGIMVMGGIKNIGETFTWLQATISAFLTWFSTNWKSILFDAFDAVTTALVNLGQNFRDFGKSAYDWIASGFSKPFDFKFTAIGAGGAARQTPAFNAPILKLSDVNEQLKEIDEKMLAVEQKRIDQLNAPGGPGKPGPKAAEFPPPLRRPAAAEFLSLTDYAKKLQIGALSTGIDYQKQIANWTQRTAEGIEKLLDKPQQNVATAVGPD